MDATPAPQETPTESAHPVPDATIKTPSTPDAAAKETKDQDPVFDWMSRNPAVAGSVLILILALLKLGAVSFWDPTTMLALVNSVGASSVITGTVFSPPWPLVLVVLTLCVRWLFVSLERGRKPYPQLTLCLLFLFLLLAVLPPAAEPNPINVTIFLLALAVMAGGVLSWRRLRKAKRSPASGIWITLVNSGTLLALLVVFIWTAFVNHLMWLPKEIAYTKGESIQGATTESVEDGLIIEGYVLSQEGEWTTFLVSGVRQTVRVRSSDIRTREVCKHHAAHNVWWIEKPFIAERFLREYWKPPKACGTAFAETQRLHPTAAVIGHSSAI